MRVPAVDLGPVDHLCSLTVHEVANRLYFWISLLQVVHHPGFWNVHEVRRHGYVTSLEVVCHEVPSAVLSHQKEGHMASQEEAVLAMAEEPRNAGQCMEQEEVREEQPRKVEKELG